MSCEVWTGVKQPHVYYFYWFNIDINEVVNMSEDRIVCHYSLMMRQLNVCQGGQVSIQHMNTWTENKHLKKNLKPKGHEHYVRFESSSMTEMQSWRKQQTMAVEVRGTSGLQHDRLAARLNIWRSVSENHLREMTKTSCTRFNIYTINTVSV